MIKVVDRYIPEGFEPTQEQINIQMATESSIVIEANAGSGKTTTLALKIVQAINSGIYPMNVMVLTFTEPACVAMRMALKHVGLEWKRVEKIQIQTFDQCAAAMLKGLEDKRIPYLPTKEELAPYVLQAIRKLDMSVDPGFVERFLNAAQKIKGTFIQEQKLRDDERLSEDDAVQLNIDHVFFKVAKVYESIRFPQRDGAAPLFRGPFDATYDLARIIEELDGPEPMTYLREITDWPENIKMLFVDEMHDMNYAMSIIMRKLINTNILKFCGVGDSDQVIHSANGAEQRFMSNAYDYGIGKIKSYELTATHRFSQSLAKLSGELANKPYASKADHDTHIACLAYAEVEDSRCEDVVIKVAKAWQTQEPKKMFEFAILLRHAWQSIHIENALLKHGLPYEVKGLKRYTMQPEVLFVRFLLAFTQNNYKQFESPETMTETIRALVFFFQVDLTKPVQDGDPREAGKTPKTRMQYAIDQLTKDHSLFKVFFDNEIYKNASPQLQQRMDAAIQIVKENSSTKDWFERFLNALEIKTWVKDIFVERQRRLDAIQNFEGLQKAAQVFPSPAVFFESLGQNERRVEESRNSSTTHLRKVKDRSKTLLITTVPEVKGLEYDHVVIPYLDAGVFPSDLNDNERDERNLFYVAITRAKLNVTFIRNEKLPSRFIAHIPVSS